jgi:hypothetical protein
MTAVFISQLYPGEMKGNCNPKLPLTIRKKTTLWSHGYGVSVENSYYYHYYYYDHHHHHPPPPPLLPLLRDTVPKLTSGN